MFGRKNLVLLGSLALSFAMFANEGEGEPEIQKYDENVIRSFQTEDELTGFIGTKIELEELRGSWSGGKVKFVLSEGLLKNKKYDKFSLFYHVAKEQYFTKSLFKGQGRGNQNTIVELVPRYENSFKNGRGGYAFETIYTSESIDNRDAFGIKPSMHYRLTDNLNMNYYLLLKKEFKGNYNDYEFLEMEPGFSYRINDFTGAGFNYFMKWARVDNDDVKDKKVTETEFYFKPYIYFNVPKYSLGFSIWGEIGPFEKEVKDYHSEILEEEYEEYNTKFGISFNKKLNEDFTLIGEVNFKDIEITKKTSKGEEKSKAYIPLYMLGIQYHF